MSRNLQLQVVLSALDKATAPIRALTKTASALGKEFKANQSKIKALNEQQRDVTAYRTANVEMRKQAKELTELRRKHSNHTAALAQTKAAHETNTAALKSARSQYNKLAGALIKGKGNTAEFKQEMDKARIRLDAATQSFSTTQKNVKTYANRIRHTSTQVDHLERRHASSQTTLGKLKTKLDEAGIGTDKLGIHSKKLKSEQDNLNKTLDAQRAKLSAVTKQQERLSAARDRYQKTQQLASSMATTGAAGIGVAYGIKSSAERIIAPGIEYGAQMSELQAVSRLGKDDDRFKMLKQQARELGASTAFSASEVGGGQTFLARAGFSPEAINSSMQDILDLALANGVDLARTADIASNISGAFKIDPEVEGNMRRVADVLSGVSARANVDLEMLGDTMKYLGKAEGLNMSLEQTAAMAGVLGNIGIQSSQAGTTMRAMLDRITAPAAAGAKAMAALGLQVKDASGNMRDMPDIIADVAKATSKMGNVDQAKYLKDIFGAEAGSGMAELIAQQGTGALSKLIEELYNVQGENAKMAATRADNIDGDLKGLSSAWQEIGIGITDINEGPLRELIQQITGILRAIGQWSQKNPELVATIAKGAAAIGVLAGVGGALMITIGSILGPLALMKYALTVVGIKGGALIPIIKGVGGGLSVMAKTIAVAFKSVFIGVLSLVKALSVTLAGAVKVAIVGAYSLAKAVLVSLVAAMKAAALAALSFAKVLLASLVSGLTAAVKAVFLLSKALLTNPIFLAVAAIAAAAYLIYKNWEPIKAFFADLWQSIKSVFGSAVAFFAELGGGMVAAFSQGLSVAWSGITEFFGNRWADIKTAFSGGIGGVSALILNWSPLGIFYQAFAGVMSYFGVELPGKFSEFGSMIMQGLINGIKNMGGAVKDAVVGMGSGVTGWFKDKLGIKSPSRVFMQLGDDTAEGLALGINANKDSPLKQVATMAKQVAAAGAIALGVSVAPAVADNNQQIKQSLQVAAIPAVQDQQQRILQSVQPVMPPVPAAQAQKQALPVLTQNIQQMIISAKQVLPDLTQRIIGVFSDPKMATGSLQQKLAIEQPAIAFDTRAPIASPAAQRSAPQAASNITINVHPSPGMDEALLAQLVQRELEKAQRQQQVRTRSRIGDLD